MTFLGTWLSARVWLWLDSMIPRVFSNPNDFMICTFPKISMEKALATKRKHRYYQLCICENNYENCECSSRCACLQKFLPEGCPPGLTHEQSRVRCRRLGESLRISPLCSVFGPAWGNNTLSSRAMWSKLTALLCKIWQGPRRNTDTGFPVRWSRKPG